MNRRRLLLASIALPYLATASELEKEDPEEEMALIAQIVDARDGNQKYTVSIASIGKERFALAIDMDGDRQLTVSWNGFVTLGSGIDPGDAARKFYEGLAEYMRQNVQMHPALKLLSTQSIIV